MGACQGTACHCHGKQVERKPDDVIVDSRFGSSAGVGKVDVCDQDDCKELEDLDAAKGEADPASLTNRDLLRQPLTPGGASPSSGTGSCPDEGREVPLGTILEEVTAHLESLRADRAWAIIKGLKATSVGALLSSLEGLPECRLPLRWLEAWGPAADALVETLTSGSLPPPTAPRPGSSEQPGEWTAFPMTPAEDDGMQGTIYVRYLHGLHGIEIRSELLMPGNFSDHFEGLVEVDYGAEVCPACFDKPHQWRAPIPGNILFHLVIKPPLLPRLWWRDIVLHRQVVNFEQGVLAIEYSPKCLKTDGCSRCNTYFKGGEWQIGLPGIRLPRCSVSGRESQFGGYYVEPAVLPDGKPGVRWRNLQVAEIHLPKWAPVAKSWYVWASAFILRRTLREFGRARAGGQFEQGFKSRAAAWPTWYREEWYRKG
mmetsp:Transcript_107889/g.336505  ORF Transcript_107889/g.336505 Transcript_107889/m.336505 type:complete len:427 (-) Transcript_107889:62-1342(-)